MRKKRRGLLALVVFGGIFLLGLTIWKSNQETVLRVGIWAGSYWDVPTGDGYAVLDAAIKKFESENPNVKVEYESGILPRDYSEWLSDKLLEGKAPDVIFIPPESFDSLVNLHALQPLGTMPEFQDTAPDTIFYQAALEAGKQEGMQYALPFESVPTLMFVNKTLLQKEGIEEIAEDWTWDDFYEICKKVTKDNDGDGQLDQFGCYDYGWQDAAASNQVKIFDEKGTSCNLTSKEMIESVRFALKIQNLSGDHTVTSKEFDLGNVAFRPMVFAEYRTYQPYPWRIKKYSDFEWDCVQMPKGPSGNHASELKTVQIGMNKRSRYKKLAWELMKTLTYDPEIQAMLYTNSQGCSPLIEVTESEKTKEILEEDTPGDSGLNLHQLSDSLRQAQQVTQFENYNEAWGRADTLIREAMGTPENLQFDLASGQIELNQYLNQ